MLPLLGTRDPFPPVESAREELGGLLAIGADLAPARLLDAYGRGIFPWGTYRDQALWYSPIRAWCSFPTSSG